MIKKKISQLDSANASLSGYIPMSDAAGTVTNKVTVQSILDLGGSGLTWSSVPASATASGTAGQIAYDGSHFYLASATNTWVRTALSTWVNFTPATVSGLQLWLDGSDASTLYDATTGGSLVAADGGVARWEDKSGNGRHATQGTSGSRPLRKTSVQGGKDVLRFDGSNDSFDISALTIPASHTVFAVFGRATQGIQSIILGDETSGQSRYSVWWFTDNIVYSRSNNDFTTHGTASTATGFFCIAETRNATASVVTRRNGAALATVTTGLGVTNAASGTWLSVGRNGSFHSGDIAEIIIYDAALSDTDRAAVESYLMTKWGIS